MGKPDTAYVCLWLEAPLQSWGEDSKFYRKDTLDFPTKSAVLGMLFSAMGLRGEQKDLLGKFDGLDMFVRGYSSECEMTSIMEDFQVMGGGYNQSDAWQLNMIPKRGDGRKPTGVSGAKLFYRYYLQSMRFGIVLEFPNFLRDQLVAGLIAPVYDIFLGRKSCIPTEFIYQGVVENLPSGIGVVEDIAEKKELVSVLTVKQGVHDGGDVIPLNDQPIQFGLFKDYKLRTVSIFRHYSIA